MYLFACTVALFITGINADSIDTIVILANSSFITSCNQGLIDTQDRIILTGRINATGITLADRPYILFQNRYVTDTSNQYNRFCRIDLSKPCGYDESSICYCGSNSNSLLEVVMNVTATTSLSQQLVRLYWPAASVFDFPDISSDFTLPFVNAIPEVQVYFNGKNVDLEKCIIEQDKEMYLNWCVSNLLNHTLTISFNGINSTSLSNCVNYTIPSSNISDTNFTVSYNETSGCWRTRSYSCSFKVSVWLTTNSTMSTTEGTVSAWLTTNSTMSTTEGTVLPHSNTACTQACIGVSVGHAACSILEIFVTIIVIIILIENNNQCYLMLACTILTLLEIGQIALVIVNAVSEIDCFCDTTIPVWGIMLLYQFIVNILLTCIDSVYLGIKSNCNTSKVFSMPLIIVVVFICIHSVFGIIAAPFILLVNGTISANSKTDSLRHPSQQTHMEEISPKNKDKPRNKVENIMKTSQDNQSSHDIHLEAKKKEAGDETQTTIGNRFKLQPIQENTKKSRKNRRHTRNQEIENEIPK